MFRARKDSDSESDKSDAELPKTPTVSIVPPKKNLNIWSDIAVEQNLENQMKGRAKVGNRAKVSRGAESYDIPHNIVYDEKRERVQDTEDVPPTSNDDPFGAIEPEVVEEFGVKKSSNSVPRDRRVARTFENKELSPSTSSKPYQRRFALKRKFDPKLAMTQDYSLEKLANVEFPMDLPLEELGKQIAVALGEMNPETTLKVVNAVGEERTLKLFEETRNIEQNGGLMVLNKSRRRTPGGVFIYLFRSDPDIPQKIKDKVFGDMKEMVKSNPPYQKKFQ